MPRALESRAISIGHFYVTKDMRLSATTRIKNRRTAIRDRRPIATSVSVAWLWGTGKAGARASSPQPPTAQSRGIGGSRLGCSWPRTRPRRNWCPRAQANGHQERRGKDPTGSAAAQAAPAADPRWGVKPRAPDPVGVRAPALQDARRAG